MSGQQIGTVVGGIIGAYFGGPAGAQLGMAIGGFIGGAIDPTKINGPHLGDGQQQTATDGAPIAWVMGTATVAGTIIAVGPRREVKIKDSGKGGPVVSHYESRQDFAILVCESSELKDSTIESIVMVEQDGKIVYDVRPGSTMLSDSAKWKANVDFMFGAEDQMPHPTLEAITGVGSTPAYRGRCVAVFKDFNIYNSGDRIPTFRFTVTSSVLETFDYDGGQSYPSQHDVTVSDAKGSYTLIFATGAIPDKFEVWDGDNLLLDTGYHGDRPTYQMALNAALTSRGDPTETIVQYPYPPGAPGPDLDDQWSDPDKREYAQFTKNTLSTTLTVKAYAPLSGTGWRFAITSANSNGIALPQVVTQIAKRGGLDADDLDTTGVSGIEIIGYPIARQCTGSDALSPLLQAYFAYATQYDLKLHFHFYGQDATVIVDRQDLVEGNDANNGAITEEKRNQATEFPRRIIGSYMDPDQNYMVVDVTAERTSSTVIAIGQQKLDIPVVMPANDAARAVQKAMKVAYAALEGSRDYCTPWARGDSVYLTVCAGEPVLMDGKRWVANEVDLSNGYMKFATRYDRQSAYTSNVQAVTGNAPTQPTSPYSGPTILIPMNLPSLRPQDTYGVYLAAKGEQSSWRGCNVQVSYDGQASWQNAATVTLPSIIGILEDDIPSGDEPLIVDVGDDLLESVTDDQLAANANAFALIDGSDHAEIWQFKTAVLQSDGTWELTDTFRGLAGTTVGSPTIGDDFVMLDSVYFLPIDTSFKGRELFFRAVGFGEVAEDQPIVSLVYDPDTTIIHDGGTVTP